MPVSRPSRVGVPPPRDDTIPDEIIEEDKVDRRLEQLERARERKKELAPQRELEKIEEKWNNLRRYFHLARRQELLLRAVDGIATTIQDAIKIVYRAKWDRLSKRQRAKYLNRLRTLQHALNTKLKADKNKHRIEMFRGKLHLVDRRKWKKPRAARFPDESKTLSPTKKNKRRLAVMRCVEFLRSLLSEKYKSSIQDGWFPVAMLNEAARRKGFRPSTILTASKRLRLQRRRIKFGGKGGWEARLPVEIAPKS
jgi:hypothetical protein